MTARQQQKKVEPMAEEYRPIDLGVFREKQMARHADHKGAIPIVLSPDKTIYIPPAELWPDEAVESVDTAPVKWAKAVLGEDYAAFTEAGGSAMLLNAIIAEAAGVAPGESPAS